MSHMRIFVYYLYW